LLPTRELALQILKVGKELVRGWHAEQGEHAGDGRDSQDAKKGQSLKWSLIVGGEGLDEQFEAITNNPDMFVSLTPSSLVYNSFPTLQNNCDSRTSPTRSCRNEARPQIRAVCCLRRGRPTL
jgi:hypothetical protein